MSDAQITVGANADAATRAASVVKSAWVEAGTAIKSAMGQAAQQVIGDLASVATAQGKVSFASQHAQVRDFEQATSRLAVSMHRDLGQVQTNIEKTGVSIGKRPQEVALWATEVGRLTYNFKGAVDAQEGLAELAAETGRQVSDYRSFAVELATVGKVGGDTTDVIGRLASQAKELGVSGGVAAFTDQVEGLSDVMSRMGGKSTDAFLKVTALAGALGKGLDPQAAARASQGAIGAVVNDPRRFERFLGRKLVDEHGQIPEKDVLGILEETKNKAKRVFGSNAQRILDQSFGNEAGSAILNADYGAARKAAGAAASPAPAAALAAYKATAAGKREGADAALAVSSRALLGSSTLLGQAADKLQQFAAHNPFTSTLITTALTTGTATFVAGFGKSLATMMGQKGAGGAVGGAIDLVKGGAGIGVAGAAGLAVGGAVLAGGLYGINKFDEAQDERFEAQKKAASAEQAHRNKVVNKAKTERAEQLISMGVAPGKAMFAAENEKQGSNPVARAQALDIELHAQIVKAMRDGLKDAKFNVTTRADTPVEVAGAGANHPAAGNQGS